ncbi:MAG: hypothetical protein RJA34_359 [Pseudomonadota bacterium]|jgi:threonine/homoserine/homoserine lactone efflux protein
MLPTMSNLTSSTLIACALFALATSITPGPNNTMLLASGVNFGFRRTVPHLLGVSGGLGLILLPASAGLQTLVALHPAVHEVLRWLGSAYLLWLAWGLAHTQASSIQTSGAAARPMGFWAAAAFQWVNPKVWVMVLGFFSTYVPPQASLGQAMALSLLFCLVNLPCVGSWALLGQHLRRWLAPPTRRRWFNRAMGGLLALSVLGNWV